MLIIGSRHPVMYWGESRMQVGCQNHTLDEWAADINTIGHEAGYTTEQIIEYVGYFEMVKAFHALHANEQAAAVTQ